MGSSVRRARRNSRNAPLPARPFETIAFHLGRNHGDRWVATSNRPQSATELPPLLGLHPDTGSEGSCPDIAAPVAQAAASDPSGLVANDSQTVLCLPIFSGAVNSLASNVAGAAVVPLHLQPSKLLSAARR
jgi:hypothetical protein